MQLTIQTFPKYRPNITLQKVFSRLEVSYEPNNKEIRLAKDLAKQLAPMNFDFHDTVRSILQCDISNERIKRVKSFKRIVYKERIEFIDGQHKPVKKLRQRNKSK